MAEGLPPSQSGDEGPVFVPIAAHVDAAGQETIQGVTYNKFTVNLTATNNVAQTVNVSVPSGCSVNPSQVGIYPPLAGTTTVWVPVSNNSSVSATVSETGYTSKLITVQGGA